MPRIDPKTGWAKRPDMSSLADRSSSEEEAPATLARFTPQKRRFSMREIVERAESKCLTPSPGKCSDTFLESSPEGRAIEELVVPHCADTQLDEETAWETNTVLYDEDGLDLALEASAARPWRGQS